jgi:PIN domain nuclease of toxin-antitoxin system
VRRYVTDTHALLRYGGAGRGRLSLRVRRVFQQCEAGRAAILVPGVVAWETALLVEDGVITLQPSLTQWWDRLASMPNYSVLPLDLDVVKAAYGLRILADPSDRRIVATALTLGLPLITADSTITDSGLVPVVW